MIDDIEQKIKEDIELTKLHNLIEGLKKYSLDPDSSRMTELKDAYNYRLADVIFGKV